MRFWPFGRSRKTETRTSPENLTYADLFGCEEDSRTKAAHIKSNALESLKYPAVWRAVSLISADVAKLPLNIWLDDPDDDKVDRRRAKRMPSYKLLRYRPNEYQTAFQYRRNQMAVALLYGNHYSLIIRDDDGRPTALIPLPSKGETYPVFESDGTMYYKTESRNGQMSKLEAQDVLHIRGLSSDGFMGVPFNQYASDSLGLGLSEQRYTSIYFENGGKPAMYLKVPKGLQDTEIKKIKKSWQELHTGINEQHKTAVLQGDIEVEELHPGNVLDEVGLGVSNRTLHVRGQVLEPNSEPAGWGDGLLAVGKARGDKGHEDRCGSLIGFEGLAAQIDEDPFFPFPNLRWVRRQ